MDSCAFLLSPPRLRTHTTSTLPKAQQVNGNLGFSELSGGLWPAACFCYHFGKKFRLIGVSKYARFLPSFAILELNLELYYMEKLDVFLLRLDYIV
jgi:hypothetical protein